MNDMVQTDIEDFLPRPEAVRTTVHSLVTTAGDMAATLGMVRSIVSKNDIIPILSCVLLDVSDGETTIVGTDMEMAITVKIPVGSGSWKAVVPAERLYDVVSKLPSGAQVTIAPGDGSVAIRAPNYRGTIRTREVIDMPNVSAGHFPCRFEMRPSDLVAALDATMFCAATDIVTRRSLCGVHMQTVSRGGADVFRFVAASGTCLGLYTIPVPAGAEKMAPITLSTRSAAEIKKIVGTTKGAIVFEISEACVQITAANVVLSSKLLDTTYPEFERVIPKAGGIILRAPFKPMLDAIRLAATFANVGREHPFVMDAGDARVLVSGGSADSGESVSEIADAEMTGPAIRIGFQTEFMMKILSAIGTDVEITMIDSQKAAVIRPCDGTDLLYVAMPYNI